MDADKTISQVEFQVERNREIRTIIACFNAGQSKIQASIDWKSFKALLPFKNNMELGFDNKETSMARVKSKLLFNGCNAFKNRSQEHLNGYFLS